MIRCQLAFTATGFVLVAAALGLAAAVRPLSLSSLPSVPAYTSSESVTPARPQSRIYCNNDASAPYSSVHKGRVCPTAQAPSSAD
jgi:hypothetical protein